MATNSSNELLPSPSSCSDDLLSSPVYGINSLDTTQESEATLLFRQTQHINSKYTPFKRVSDTIILYTIYGVFFTFYSPFIQPPLNQLHLIQSLFI